MKGAWKVLIVRPIAIHFCSLWRPCQARESIGSSSQTLPWNFTISMRGANSWIDAMAST